MAAAVKNSFLRTNLMVASISLLTNAYTSLSMTVAFDQQTRPTDPQREAVGSSQQETNVAAQALQALLKVGLDHFRFGPLTEAVRGMHLTDPNCFSYSQDTAGLTFPSPLSLLRDQQVAETAEQLQAA